MLGSGSRTLDFSQRGIASGLGHRRSVDQLAKEPADQKPDVELFNGPRRSELT